MFCMRDGRTPIVLWCTVPPFLIIKSNISFSNARRRAFRTLPADKTNFCVVAWAVCEWIYKAKAALKMTSNRAPDVQGMARDIIYGRACCQTLVLVVSGKSAVFVVRLSLHNRQYIIREDTYIAVELSERTQGFYWQQTLVSIRVVVSRSLAWLSFVAKFWLCSHSLAVPLDKVSCCPERESFSVAVLVCIALYKYVKVDSGCRCW